MPCPPTELAPLFPNPAHISVSDLPDLLEKYDGAEQQLLAAAREKYDEGPRTCLQQAIAVSVLPSHLFFGLQ